jgi:hypothetical protein
MEISEFLGIVEERFSELGDPTNTTSDACCPLGLVHGDPQDLNPDPDVAAATTGLPLEYCVGVAEGWDNAPGSFYGHSWTTEGRANYLRGFRDGGTARHRWFRLHPKSHL